jgi:hypothetical protein
MSKAWWVLGVVSLVAAWPCQAQRVNIDWQATTDDTIGRQLVTAVRERLAVSPLFTLVYGEGESAIVAHFITQDPDQGRVNQTQTSYSLTITIHFRSETFERFITSYAGVCGSNRVHDCAAAIVADIDQFADAIRRTTAE